MAPWPEDPDQIERYDPHDSTIIKHYTSFEVAIINKLDRIIELLEQDSNRKAGSLEYTLKELTEELAQYYGIKYANTR